MKGLHPVSSLSLLTNHPTGHPLVSGLTIARHEDPLSIYGNPQSRGCSPANIIPLGFPRPTGHFAQHRRRPRHNPSFASKKRSDHIRFKHPKTRRSDILPSRYSLRKFRPRHRRHTNGTLSTHSGGKVGAVRCPQFGVSSTPPQ